MFEKNKLSLVIRVFSYSILATTFVFLMNNVLTVWFDWPGVKNLNGALFRALFIITKIHVAYV